MRFREVALLGVVAALALGACTSTPESASESAAPTRSSEVEPVSDELGRIEWVTSPTFLTGGPIPDVVEVRTIQLETALNCESKRRTVTQYYWVGMKSLRKTALSLTRDSLTAVIVRRGADEATVLEVDRTESVISVTKVTQLDDRWIPMNGRISCSET